MKSSIFQKMTRKIWRISALCTRKTLRAEILQIFRVIFWKINDFINSFWLNLTFSSEGSHEWHFDHFINIFCVKHTFNNFWTFFHGLRSLSKRCHNKFQNICYLTVCRYVFQWATFLVFTKCSRGHVYSGLYSKYFQSLRCYILT